MDLLTHELKLLSTTADSTSERVLVISRVFLPRDPMIIASKDIRTITGRRIEDCKENKFDKLLAEAMRCGKKKQLNHDNLADKHVSKVLPIAAENFDLSEVEFRDALSVRYNKNLIASPFF